VIALFCTTQAFFYGVTKAIQDYIDTLVEGEDAIKLINEISRK
jgi:hypothetical protein